MTEIEKLVQIFLNVSEVVAFIWGPIKLMLMIASSKLETLEFLLDTYVEFGELIPHLQQYDRLFASSPSVLEVLGRYVEDILRFHQNALKVFSRPGWRIFFDSTWKTFRTDFKPIAESLKRHRALLADERLNAAVSEVQVTRDQILTGLDVSSIETTRKIDYLSDQVSEVYRQIAQQLYSIEHRIEDGDTKERTATLLKEVRLLTQKLEPPDYEADHQGASEQRYHESGSWFLREPLFLRWSTSQTLPNTTLYIHGMPGAGKTVLASKVISHLRNSTSFSTARCLFFFFKHREDTKHSMTDMLRAVIVQLLTQDPTLVGASFEEYGSVSDRQARSLTCLKSWAKMLLLSQRECHIILDGLDECPDNGKPVSESIGILDWFLKEIMPETSAQGSSLRLLITGQRDGILDKALFKYPTFKLDTFAAHLDDIKSFTRAEASKLGRRFSLEGFEEQSIAKKVVEASNGMFLYATVVMGNLLAQGSATELDDELTVNFPDGLDKAYERVAVRLLEHPGRRRTLKESAAKILHWIACATRPLKWREIQSLFCVDPMKGICIPRNKRVDDCKTICGSFVDVEHSKHEVEECELIVRFVHDTALRFLIDTRRLDLFQEQANMAIFSTRYLASSPFEKGQDAKAIFGAAISGYYGLLDYIVVYWQRHVDIVLTENTTAPPNLIIDLNSLLKTRFEAHALEPYQCGANIEDPPTIESVPNNECFRSYEKILEERCSSIRKILETIWPQIRGAREQNDFLAFNGLPRYKCSKSQCRMFSEGFLDRESRNQHVRNHKIQFFCPKDNCPHHTLGFTSGSDLQRHTKTSHPQGADTQYVFPSSAKTKDDIWSACASGNLSNVKSCIAQGVDPKLGKREGAALSPIVCAARNSHLPVCEYLVSQGCSIYDAKDRTKRNVTAAGEAIKAGNSKLFYQLVQLGTEDQRADFVQGPLLQSHIAAAISSGCRELLDTLLSWESGRQDRLKPFDIFVSACAIARIGRDAIELYEYYWSLLDADAKNELLSKTYRKSPSIYWNGGNMIHRACRSENLSAMSVLVRHATVEQLEHGTRQAENPLQFAAQRSLHVFKFILEINAAVDINALNSRGQSVLHLICRGYPHNDSTKVLRLIFGQVRHLVNVQDYEGRTPLHIAVAKGGLELVTALLEDENCDLSIKDKEGKTVFEVGEHLQNNKEEINTLLHLSQLKRK
ncbi:hypothetical protein PFICI_07847 [Pestalotiopsis fici W106-1]|uniref:NACHT domain-containing protein n=1 Tax=Pestalotiopsis fici (strain W106-1 / CGMCC3.15140) TaxID=1229662 RepID=W3X2F7_PESFW|nr:uncharacterized protein PFICI_07847 [Pestalotiopsis fici W106-1]ETS80318.1 hypothetical protein PFICI_07847 [Pestalotiopsis fici W106-1]